MTRKTTVTFVTGNSHKARYVSELLGFEINHYMVDIDEIQSLDIEKVVRHKAEEAFKTLQSPVLIHDNALVFEAWGKLPSTFIKWFREEVSDDVLCGMLGDDNRAAVAVGAYCYKDATKEKLFTGRLQGSIARQPQGDGGFGWDRIFIPKGFDKTRAELDSEDDRATYLQINPIGELKQYLRPSYRSTTTDE